MARSGRMNLHIDLNRYLKLPSDVRMRFDGWLREERLDDELAVALTLGEGHVTIEHLVTDADGHAVLDESGEVIVTAVKTLPVRSVPPLDAFGS